MKRIYFVVVGGLFLTCSLATATTNDLSATLQRGLFEEEANHDLNAAVSAYQDVVNQFDKDRKVAATAVFRLGECYRKQGRTNEANARYERVLREFPDQTELAALSRTYVGVAGLSAASPRLAAGGPMSDAQAAASLAEAVEVQRIKAMLKDSPDLINAKDPHDGHTLLQQAAEAGQLEVAKFLLANGADIEGKNPNYSSRTALHFAAAGGHKAMVELLMDKGANVNVSDSEGKTPLYLAVENGYRNLVEVLVAKGANVNAKTQTGATPLHVAAANGFISIAQFLIGHGADLNALTTDVRPLSNQGVFSGAPLDVAAMRGDLSFAELLLTNKAEVNAADWSGRTPLRFAADARQTAMAALLLSHGANVDARDKLPDRGWTPLVVAVDHDQNDMVTLLLTNKADPNVRFDFKDMGNQLRRGWTPLLLAVYLRRQEIVRSLLEAKADPNMRGEGGDVAIFWTDGTQVLRLLLDHGAEVDARDAGEQTPLLRACWGGNPATIELLLAHKADPNARDRQGATPLHYLVQRFQNSHLVSTDTPVMARMLISAGANVNALDKTGQTPLAELLQLGARSTSLAAVMAPGSRPAAARTFDAAVQEFATLLREHGGVKDMPLPDRIQVHGPGTKYSRYIFAKGTNDWNQFTLLELVAVQYDFLTGSPEGGPGSKMDLEVWSNEHQELGFPDFSRVLLHQSGPKGREQKVDLSAAFDAGDCSKDVPLDWGEVVEVPQADHPLNQRWPGFTTQQFLDLKHCVARQVQVVVKGRTNNITLAPQFTVTKTYHEQAGPQGRQIISPEDNVTAIATAVPYWIKPVLINSGLILTSSDLSRVKVTRSDPVSGQKREWMVDCSEGKPAPDLWLRDGDIIEVPEK